MQVLPWYWYVVISSISTKVFGEYIKKFCQVKALTPLKQLMRSKGALKDQSRLIQHFSKRIANSQLSVQALKKAVFKKRYILITLFEKAK